MPDDRTAPDAECEQVAEHRPVRGAGDMTEGGWLHTVCACGGYAWPCPHWLLAEHARLTAQVAEQDAAIQAVRDRGALTRVLFDNTPDDWDENDIGILADAILALGAGQTDGTMT